MYMRSCLGQSKELVASSEVCPGLLLSNVLQGVQANLLSG
jgi:hypothetical protein